MFFLYNMFQDGNSLDATGTSFPITSLTISNGIFDHLNLLSVIYSGTNKFDTEKPEEWDKSTILNVTFNNTLDGGSISDLINDIVALEIQRKPANGDEWVTLHRIDKDENGALTTEFSTTDAYNQSGVEYIYQIAFIDKNGNIGSAIQQNVLSLFNDAYIADANHIYKITNEYQINSQKNQKSAIYEPYGSKYPFVAYNAETKYDSGSVTAVLLAPTSNSATSSYLDRIEQSKMVEEFNSWLTNGRAKILKDFNGMLKIVAITDPIPNSYYKELGNGLASTTFNFIEIGSMEQEYLDNLGLSKLNINKR